MHMFWQWTQYDRMKLKKDKAQQDEIDRKVEEYRKRQEKDSSEIKR